MIKQKLSSKGELVVQKNYLKRINKDLRPTTSKVLSALFSMIGPNGLEGKDVIDIFAGTGNFGISALRRGANSAIFLDINKKRCEKIKLLLNQSNFKNTNYVINGSVPKAISKISRQADIVFVDPPYDQNPFEEVMNSLKENNILRPKSMIFMEHSRKTTLPNILPGVVLTARKLYGDSALTLFRAQFGETI